MTIFSWSKCLTRPKEKTKPKAMKANNAMEGWTEAMVNVEDAKKQEKMANERRFAYRCALVIGTRLMEPESFESIPTKSPTPKVLTATEFRNTEMPDFFC